MQRKQDYYYLFNYMHLELLRKQNTYYKRYYLSCHANVFLTARNKSFSPKPFKRLKTFNLQMSCFQTRLLALRHRWLDAPALISMQWACPQRVCQMNEQSASVAHRAASENSAAHRRSECGCYCNLIPLPFPVTPTLNGKHVEH